MIFHGSRSVFMVFNGSRLLFMVFHGSRLVFHGPRLFFMAFHCSRFVLWFQVGFHGFSWFKVFIRVINIVLIRLKISLSSGKLNIFFNRMIIISGIGEERRVL